ncbi:MAG: sodium:proton antiporter [Planctomycetota bacterium]
MIRIPTSALNEPLYLIPFLVAAGVGAQWLAARFRFPALLLLLATGLLLGWLNPDLQELLIKQMEDRRGGLRAFISLAVSVVLFEGGMSLNLLEAQHVGKSLRRLILSGLIVGFTLVSLCAHYVAKLDWGKSCTLGAILVVTGPTVIIPMLRSARIALRPAALLKWEGIVNDPLGALLAIFVASVASVAGDLDLTLEFLGMFLGTSVLAGALGAVVGYLLAKALNAGVIAEHVKTAVILAAVLVVSAACDAIAHESGLLAVTIMGVVLGNTDNHSIEDIRRFKEQISTVLVSVLFILLSAQLKPEALQALVGPKLILIGLILFAVRPVVALFATLGSDLPWQERVIVGWIAPRGVVAAAVAGALAPELMPIVFGVILATVVLHGLSIRPLARALGLAARAGTGILIVGASLWGVSLAQALAKAGASVVLADTRFRRVSRARMEGLEVHHGDVLAEEAAMELPMEQVSWVLAAADDDSYNALVCLRFAPELGREVVLQLTPGVQEKKGEEVKSHMKGRNPWGDEASYRNITSRFWRGASFKTTQITEEFTWENLRENAPEGMFMFYLHQGRLQILVPEAEPPTGSKVIYLA